MRFNKWRALSELKAIVPLNCVCKIVSYYMKICAICGWNVYLHFGIISNKQTIIPYRFDLSKLEAKIMFFTLDSDTPTKLTRLFFISYAYLFMFAQYSILTLGYYWTSMLLTNSSLNNVPSATFEHTQ